MTKLQLEIRKEYENLRPKKKPERGKTKDEDGKVVFITALVTAIVDSILLIISLLMDLGWENMKPYGGIPLFIQTALLPIGVFIAMIGSDLGDNSGNKTTHPLESMGVTITWTTLLFLFIDPAVMILLNIVGLR